MTNKQDHHFLIERLSVNLSKHQIDGKLNIDVYNDGYWVNSDGKTFIEFPKNNSFNFLGKVNRQSQMLFTITNIIYYME